MGDIMIRTSRVYKSNLGWGSPMEPLELLGATNIMEG